MLRSDWSAINMRIGSKRRSDMFLMKFSRVIIASETSPRWSYIFSLAVKRESARLSKQDLHLSIFSHFPNTLRSIRVSPSGRNASFASTRGNAAPLKLSVPRRHSRDWFEDCPWIDLSRSKRSILTRYRAQALRRTKWTLRGRFYFTRLPICNHYRPY